MQLRYALTQVTPPAVEPVSPAEAKRHLRVEGADEDAMLGTLITAARRQAESYMGRALITQVWEMDLDRFPYGEIGLPRPPLQSLERLAYVAANGVVQTIEAAKYRVDAKREPGRVTPVHGATWPATRAVTNAVTVRFTAGYGGAASDVPEDIRQAILLIVGRLYAHREDVLTGPIATRMPHGAESLMGPYRVVRV